MARRKKGEVPTQPTTNEREKQQVFTQKMSDGTLKEVTQKLMEMMEP